MKTPAPKAPRKPRKANPKSAMPKYIDNCSRDPLGEGRSYGIGFAFCKKEGDTFTTVGPLSPCKDYLNDQVYSEATGEPYRAYGYKAKKHGIFEGGFGYVVFGVMPEKGYTSANSYTQQPKETAWLAENFTKIAEFINQFEEKLKLEHRTTVIKVEDNRYIATVPLFWCQYTYTISLWSLLARICLESYWMGGDAIKSLEDCTTGDSMLAGCAITKFNRMVAGERPVQDFTKNVFWHNEGISGFSFENP